MIYIRQVLNWTSFSQAATIIHPELSLSLYKGTYQIASLPLRRHITQLLQLSEKPAISVLQNWNGHIPPALFYAPTSCQIIRMYEEYMCIL